MTTVCLKIEMASRVTFGGVPETKSILVAIIDDSLTTYNLPLQPLALREDNTSGDLYFAFYINSDCSIYKYNVGGNFSDINNYSPPLIFPFS